MLWCCLQCLSLWRFCQFRPNCKKLLMWISKERRPCGFPLTQKSTEHCLNILYQLVLIISVLTCWILFSNKTPKQEVKFDYFPVGDQMRSIRATILPLPPEYIHENTEFFLQILVAGSKHTKWCCIRAAGWCSLVDEYARSLLGALDCIKAIRMCSGVMLFHPSTSVVMAGLLTPALMDFSEMDQKLQLGKGEVKGGETIEFLHTHCPSCLWMPTGLKNKTWHQYLPKS